MTLGRVEQLQVFDDRAERKRRDVGQRTDQDDRRDQQDHKQHTVGGQRAGGDLKTLFRGQRARNRQHRHDDSETSEPHGNRERDVVERRVGAQPAERAAIVVGG